MVEIKIDKGAYADLDGFEIGNSGHANILRNALINEEPVLVEVEEEEIDLGLTTGYRDGDHCVETKDFPFGKPLPMDWVDTPKELKNYYGNASTDFTKVK